MKCQECGQENRPDAAFCMSCGAPLPDVPFARLEKSPSITHGTGGVGTGAPAGPGERTVPMPEVPRAAAGETLAARPPVTEPTMPSAPAGSPPRPAAAASPGVQGATVGGEAPPRRDVARDAHGVDAGRSVVEEIRVAGQAAEGSGASRAPAGETLAARPPVTEPTMPSAPAGSPPRPAAAASPGVQGATVGGEAPPRRDVPRDAHGVDAGTTGGAVSPAAYPIRAEGAVPPRPAQETGGAVGQPSRPAERYQIYVPPEADYVAHIQGRGAVPPTEVAPRQRAEETPRAPAAAAEPEKTQVVFPMAQQPSPPRPVARATVTCPECYAPNPEGNSFCQECGSPLSPVAARPRTIRQAAAFREGDQRTAALAPGMVPEAEARGAYAGKTKRVPKGEKAFGVADVLALLAAGTAGAALALSSVMESFSWKKGLAVSMFTHQGAFTQGRPDLLGGPGILPYEGMEFLTVGLVAALGIALALVFLAARVGRGPMFILAGSLLLFPLAYLLFQAVLPLRQTGIEIQPSLGIGGLLSGGESNPGMGPPLWMISGAGILLLAAGFAAPPRGWGRLFTFMAFFPGVLGLAFFCAACYNWNLFISAAGMLEAWRVGAAPTAPGARIPLP